MGKSSLVLSGKVENDNFFLFLGLHDFKSSVVCILVLLAGHMFKHLLTACVGEVIPWEDEVYQESIYSSVPKGQQRQTEPAGCQRTGRDCGVLRKMAPITPFVS